MSGTLVQMPSTPHAASARIRSGWSTVHTLIPTPRRCAMTSVTALLHYHDVAID